MESDEFGFNSEEEEHYYYYGEEEEHDSHIDIEEQSRAICSDLLKHFIDAGKQAMSLAHEDWKGKPFSAWPYDIKESIFRKGILDLFEHTLKEQERQGIAIINLEDQVQRLSNPSKNQIGFHQNN